jgi:hypothetical protein
VTASAEDSGTDFSTLPQYVSHKVVRAVAISAAERGVDGGWNLATGRDCGPFKLDPETSNRFKITEDDLGYLVVYADGYVSWSPTKAFEEGYTRVVSTGGE